MRKLVLRNHFSPGDVVMLTAAVRDLHAHYPGAFQTDVRTRCPELWEHNPHLTPLSESDPGVEAIDCLYPLIDRANELPYHCLHGFIQFLNERLGLQIRPTAFKGDVHLSPQERAWHSQVQEYAGRAIPFWIINAGGKHDITIKWWSIRRFQQVVDHFRGRIQFVQIGDWGHHHSKLNGVIDLRGRTTLRELVRLVHHADGVLCPVTGAMHLAAAVPTRSDKPAERACVVLAGGREPVHWEAYPHHQFIHTVGALSCCARGGCWRDRTIPLRDGNERDEPDRLCLDVRGDLPRCMDMIEVEEVVRRIERYYSGGALRYLSKQEAKAARTAVLGSQGNPFDRQPLTLSEAGLACDRVRIAARPRRFHGRGIVICAGGARYFTNAWVCINMLRHLGCRLPIEVWHLGPHEMNRRMRALLKPLNVRCLDAMRRRKEGRRRRLGGWESKACALLHSSFREVLFLDADNVPVRDPEYLFEEQAFQETGAIFWPDFGREERGAAIWKSCGLAIPDGPEFESGQMLVDRKKCWKALYLAAWFNSNSDFYYQYLHGDKETFHLAFRKAGQPFHLVKTPPQRIGPAIGQHDLQGRLIFQHRTGQKWNLFLNQQPWPGFRFERQCRDFVRQLRRLWDGGAASIPECRAIEVQPSAPEISACLVGQRDSVRTEPDGFPDCDWPDPPIRVCHGETAEELFRNALTECLSRSRSFYLLLASDVMVNQHLHYNLQHWRPLQGGLLRAATLHNYNVVEEACDVRHGAQRVGCGSLISARALLFSRDTLERLAQTWDSYRGPVPRRVAAFCTAERIALLSHVPSLVEHVSAGEGGPPQIAGDFSSDWRAESLPA